MPNLTQARRAREGRRRAEDLSLDGLLTPPAVATLFDASLPAVYAALRQEQWPLEHIRTPGGQIRIRRRDVLAFCHRNAFEVPDELLQAPRAFVVHPDRRVVSRLDRLLASVAQPCPFTDPVDALLRAGAERPAMVLFSCRFEEELVERVTQVLGAADRPGYTCLLLLVPGRIGARELGPLPVPLHVGEFAGKRLAALVGELLGTG